MQQPDRGIALYLELMKKALTASLYDESKWSVIPHSTRKQRALRTPRRPLEFARKLGEDWLIRTMRKRSVLLVKNTAFNVQHREEGLDWPLFGYTMIGHRRLDNIQTCVEAVLHHEVPGDFIETGAWRGGAVIFMRALLQAHNVTDRTVWVADSFEGLPAPKSADDGLDLSEHEILKVSLEKVRDNFARFGLLDEQVKFLPGWFSDTLPDAPIEKLAILRLDGDLYSSTTDALNNLYHKVSAGGYVIVDDYNSWPSCRRAVTEFLARHDLQPEIKPIDAGGVYWKV